MSSRADRLGMGPLAFWFLNHELEEAELQRQMMELKEKGFSGFFMHSRGGLQVPYGPQGSRRWREVIAFCVKQARELGLEAWLYDEDPYPSGAAGGRVSQEHPEFRAMELLPVVAKVTRTGKVVLDLPEGVLMAAYLVSERGGRIERIDDSAGMIRSRWRQCFMAFGYYASYQTSGGPHWRAETVEPHSRIVLDEAPAGATVVAFVKRSALQSPWGEYTDMLNAEAVELFLRYTYDAYAELLGAECGSTVPGIFTDEAKLKGRLPWSAEVPRWFREVAGSEFFDALPHLVMEIDERTPYYRWAYRKALARGLRQAMVKPMVAACQRHQLLLTGHVSPEEDPIGQTMFAPGLMGVIGRMDLPGTDLIGAVLGGELQPLLHLSPKIASSAAHGHGKRWVTCEAFAVCDWAQDMAALTRAVHWLYALGVNRLITHGQFYSIDGLRKREAPPSQFIQAAYWEHFGAFSAMVELLSKELAQGSHLAPLLLYYPEDSFMAMIAGVAGEDGAAEEMRAALGALVHALLTSGYDFDFADEELLLQTAGEKGKLMLREERFEVIVIPGQHLSEVAWQKLQDLQRDGARVLYIEPEITVLSAQPMIWRTEGGESQVWEILRREVSPLWRGPGGLIGHCRETAAGPLMFLCNNSRQEVCGTISVFFKGPYEICDPQEGKWRGAEQLELRLCAGLGVLIRQRRTGMITTSRTTEAAASWGDWSCSPCADNSLVVSEFRVLHRQDTSPPEIREFGVAAFVDLLSPTSLESGLSHVPGDRYLLAGFDWEAGEAAIRMVCDTDLGEGAMEFYLNGRRLPEPVRKRTYDPMNREIDLAPWVSKGRNHLLWVQRRTGLEKHLELPYDALRLFGDFHVEFPFGRPMPARLTPRPPVYRTGFPVPASQMGHPHYGGLIRYESAVRFHDALREQICLEIGRGYESMQVEINGHPVGTIWSEPWQLEVPTHWLKPGENRLVLTCACSPATYLQALPRPSGFLGPVRWSYGTARYGV